MPSRIASSISLVVVLVLASGVAAAGEVGSGGEEAISVKGFLSATLFAQDRSFAFGNGQNAVFPVPGKIGGDPWFMDGDVRNSRLTLAMNGPEAQGFKLGGGLELDFFGGYAGTSAFSDEQPVPRLRLAYADLKRGATTVRVGQYWSPLFGEVPVSVSRLAFPIGYSSAGFVGWRFPGVFVYHDFGAPDAATKVQLQLAAMRGSWTAPGATDAEIAANILSSKSAGNASMVPQLEARLNVDGKSGGASWGFYVAGHYDRKDLSGVGDATEDNLNGTAAEFGLRLKVAGFLVHGNAYYGRAIGQQFGALAQFGDITSMGGWLQLGYDVTDNFGLFVFGGIDDPNDDDVLAAGGSRVKNVLTAVTARYSVGPWALGLEWFYDELTSGAAETKAIGNQIALSTLYKF